MNSRERVLKAVNFETPDRVPIDLGAIRASGINAVIYDQLKKRMGINSPTRVHDSMQDVPVENVEVMFEAAYEFGTLVPRVARQPFSTRPD